MDEVLKALEMALATALAGAVTVLARQLAAKFKLDLDASAQAATRAVVQNAILATEEKAAASLKRSSVAVTGAEKLDAAVGLVLAKVPGVTADEAAQLVHEELPKIRAAAGGALSALVAVAAPASAK